MVMGIMGVFLVEGVCKLHVAVTASDVSIYEAQQKAQDYHVLLHGPFWEVGTASVNFRGASSPLCSTLPGVLRRSG